MRSSAASIRVVIVSLVVAVLGCAAAMAQQPQQAADLIVTNAKVVTVDTQRPQATAVAVQGGTFVAVGDDADMAPHRGEQTRVIDALGHTVIPGLNWPLRQHATYGESVKVVMDVFEQVQREQGRFAPRWAIDHAETVRDEELRRIKAMGGGIAIQNRMAFAGESFVERYGKGATTHAPPIRQMLQMGIPVGAGTDGTRVSSYNPWPSLYWLVSGKTVGGTPLFAADNTLSRQEALRLFTVGSAWFSQEEDVKGRIAPGQYADFAVLSDDYFSVPEEQIKDIASVLTVVAGKVVYAAKPFDAFAPPALPPVRPDWSPVAHFGGYQHQKKAERPR